MTLLEDSRKQNKIMLLILRLAIIVALIFYTYCYVTETDIIKNTVTQPYKITKLHCHSGRSGSTVCITSQGELHYVSLKNKVCDTLAVNQFINLYHHKTLNYYFVKEEVKFVGPVIFFLLFCFTFTFKYLTKAEERFKQSASSKNKSRKP